MTKTHLLAISTLMRRIEHEALVRRGRHFMRARQAFVGDRDCLPSMFKSCIAEGAQTRDDIVRNVPRFVGHSYAEVASVLDQFSGPSAEEHYWYRDDAKVYHLTSPRGLANPPSN